jgi:hypothetical protein
MMLAAILGALDIPYEATAYCSHPPSERDLKVLGDKFKISDFELFKSEVMNYHVYATPSMSVKSFDLEAATAMAAGCIVVAPKHSGYQEHFSHFGVLCTHSVDNFIYASSFGARLLDARSIVSNESADRYRESQTGLCSLFYNDILKAKWSQLEELMSLKDA